MKTNIVRLTPNDDLRRTDLVLNLIDYNDYPERLLELSQLAQIEYAAAKAKDEYRRKCALDFVDVDEAALEDLMRIARIEMARRIGYKGVKDEGLVKVS